MRPSGLARRLLTHAPHPDEGVFISRSRNIAARAGRWSAQHRKTAVGGWILFVVLAAAILIDATIVRAVVLPATMKLLGKHNWYLPKGLGWLPKFEPEPAAVPAAA